MWVGLLKEHRTTEHTPLHAGSKTNKATSSSPPLAGAASFRGVCLAFRLTEVIVIWGPEDKLTGFGPLENLWVLSQSNQEQTSH